MHKNEQFMKLEHIALNVKDPLGMTEWYVEHLGLSIATQKQQPPYTSFLSDYSGQILIEVYNNPADAVPDYRNMNPLHLHVAFVSKDPELDAKHLIDAGASFEQDTRLEDGSHLIMLRDPWGLPLQLCKRASPMLK